MVDVVTRLLRRLIEEPHHVQAVRHLEPDRFVSVVREVGLEDAGELVAMATPAQNLHLLDTLLWQADRGEPLEHLDVARVVVWLEVVLEGGDAAAARRLRELPEELLAALVLGQLFVLGPDALGHDLAGVSWARAELAERVLDECLHLELGGYTVVARHELGWDPTIAALLALDTVDHARVERVLDRCWRATAEELADVEDDGLHAILDAGQTLHLDALADRESRRSAQGYVSVADARAFLALAERGTTDDPTGLDDDPIVRAYLRELDVEPRAGLARRQRGEAPSRALAELVEHVRGEPAAATPALPAGARGAGEPSPVETLRRALHALVAEDPSRHAEQLVRLAFVANVLVTAGDPNGLPVAAAEASERCLQAVAEGLGQLTARGQEALAVLRRVGVDALFRLGWRRVDPSATAQGPS